MKKTINVNGTNFTVDVNISAEDRYKSIKTDYKKILYLLGKVSAIGSDMDYEFTTRNRNLDWTEDSAFDKPCHVKDGMKELKLTTREKNTIVSTIDSTMWWFDALKGQIKNL